jgi:dTDP-4-dehydrorhamnose 3,5-epimerase-like enzyme
MGHALMSLSSRSTTVYLCSTRYDPASDHAISPLDPELAIGWPPDIEPVLSARDAAAPTLAEAYRRDLLPVYRAQGLVRRTGLSSGTF